MELSAEISAESPSKGTYLSKARLWRAVFCKEQEDKFGRRYYWDGNGGTRGILHPVGVVWEKNEDILHQLGVIGECITEAERRASRGSVADGVPAGSTNRYHPVPAGSVNTNQLHKLPKL
jgi:hypothetical protein